MLRSPWVALAAVLALASVVSAQVALPNGNVTGTKNEGFCGFSGTCADISERALLKSSFNRGDSMIMYMNISSNAGLTYTTTFPMVDKFSILEIPDSGNFTLTNSPNISMSITTSAGTITSEVRSMRRSIYFVGFRSIIINMDKGVVTSLVWDEEPNCGTDCSNDVCIDNACGIEEPNGGAAACGVACNIKVYITWFGTDASNRQLMSSSFSMLNIRSWWPFAFQTFINMASSVFAGAGQGGFGELEDVFPTIAP